MNIKEMQEKIMKLKKEKDICILAHSYQAKEIVEIADFTGDSYQLSVLATTAPQKTILMCGVRFMAETAKILSPDKKVLIANKTAGCPMAEQMSVEEISAFKKANPDYTIVAYINTTAALKTVCDVCVTSSSAVSIVDTLENDNILFIPDCNLGDYVAKQLPSKNIKLLQGGCPVHAQITEADVLHAKELYPNAELLVHPECKPEVVAHADYIGSTVGIMNYAKQSEKKQFIIGTEISIAELLAYECPNKQFFPLSKKLICTDMKATTLVDVLHTIEGCGGEEIILDDATIHAAKKCIDRMIELGQ
ncbi:MAG: quinolinate synthase NadA [Eubacteriales bacterium]|nr:quinolinate synthase NadA [Eubacteriales bacterium]